MRKKTTTAYVYALPQEILPETVGKSIAQPLNSPTKISIRINRCDSDGLVESKIVDIFQWFSNTLRATNITEDAVIEASLAIPALSLSIEYWDRAAKMLAEKLAEFNTVIGNVYTPKNVKLSTDTKFAVADWYSALYSGFLSQNVVEYENKKEEVVKFDVAEEEEPLDSESP